MRVEHEEEQKEHPGLWARIKSSREKFAFASLIITVLGLLVTVVVAYSGFQQQEPGVTFEIVSESNALDLRRAIPDLHISFRGQDVREQNLNLRIVTIDILNSGGLDIRNDDYDPIDWGMKFNGGEVAEVKLINASSSYLQESVIPQRIGLDTVRFEKVTFDKGASFTIEILLLHAKDVSPSISPIGKIAGINEIPVLARPLAEENVDFLTELFPGSLGVQLIRTIIYIVGTSIVIAAGISFMIGLDEFSSKKDAQRRRRRIVQTRTIRQMPSSGVRDLLIREYEMGGTVSLKRLQELIIEPETIEWVTPPGRWVAAGHRRDYFYHDIETIAAGRVFDIPIGMIGTSHTLRVLAEAEVLESGNDGEAVIDSEFVDNVNVLLSELED